MSHLQTFNLTERDLRPGCREIHVDGELDLAVAEQLEEALERALTECRQVLIDLEGCGFIDSTGIAAIVHAHKQANLQGGKVALYAPSDQVLRVLSMTGLTNNGLVFDTAEEALSHP
jgi:anti-sigma B factor antagonist